MSLIEHTPTGDPCRCGAPEEAHSKRRERHRSRKSHPRGAPVKPYYIGIDGEGQGREVHRYVLLAWSDKEGRRRNSIYNPNGLPTKDCLDFLLAIPRNAKAFTFSFNYDLTKILTDVSDHLLYHLMRPESRKVNIFPAPIVWKGYRINWIAGKVSIKKGSRSIVIWDVFKFFQSKFTKALELWKVGETDRLERMRAMKDQRADFDKLEIEQIREYCFDECRDMAALAEKLTVAHKEAGLNLKNYFGAGSSASAMLEKMSIATEKRDGPQNHAFHLAVASAFFGGRFENSVLGEVRGEIWGYDISSAYPYQTTFLPCLKCGKWSLTMNRKDIEDCTTAIVRYRLSRPHISQLHWAPFPFRTNEGSICFPGTSGGGWVWREEFLAGERVFSNVKFLQAYVYRTDCNHRPFGDIPKYYLERLRLGKEGAGIVLKLSTNAVYGKLAQSIGSPKYQSWIWAGMITSGTRAQILGLLEMHRDPRNLLMVATDGIYTRERLSTPRPRDTGTFHVSKPLGGWEEKRWERGVFLARPGIYCPIDPTFDEVANIRARGIGRGTMFEHWRRMVEAVRKGEWNVELPTLTRFHGIKSSIHQRLVPKHDNLYEYHRSQDYGQWTTRPVVVSFNPLPKRESVRSDQSLVLRAFENDIQSTPYSRSLYSVESQSLMSLYEEMLEQPDGGDFTEYEVE